MKNLLLILLLLLSASPASAAEFRLDWSAVFVPPHNEPVIGDKVARYRLQLEPAFTAGPLEYEGRINAWGVNTWRPSDAVGHGFPEAWEGSDWSIETVRCSMTSRLTVWLHEKRFGFFAEHYFPFDRKSWGGHGLERHYYLLTGFRGRLW